MSYIKLDMSHMKPHVLYMKFNMSYMKRDMSYIKSRRPHMKCDIPYIKPQTSHINDPTRLIGFDNRHFQPDFKDFIFKTDILPQTTNNKPIFSFQRAKVKVHYPLLYGFQRSGLKSAWE